MSHDPPIKLLDDAGVQQLVCFVVWRLVAERLGLWRVEMTVELGPPGGADGGQVSASLHLGSPLRASRVEEGILETTSQDVLFLSLFLSCLTGAPPLG